MMHHERKQYILELINRDRIVKAADLVDRFGVSMETIRRDLEELEKCGNLRRVYGGAVLGTIYSPEPAYNNREIKDAEQKRSIAAKVYDLISEGDTLFLDGGTTLMEVAKCIAAGNKQGITVITNAVQVACETVKNEYCSVVLLGGGLSRGEPLTSGSICSSELANYHADKMIMGAAGVSLAFGVTDHSFVIGSLKREMIKRVDQIICATDFSKFNQNAANCICPIRELSMLVTDWHIDAETSAAYEAAGTRVVVAPESKYHTLSAE